MPPKARNTTSIPEALASSAEAQQSSQPPRDGLVRALRPGLELRAAGDEGMPTLFGHFAIFNEWTEIDSIFEGHFLERIAPGAFRKTFREQRDEMRVLFQHGMDWNIGDKPLGPIEDLREDKTGAYYEAPLLDTSYNRDLLPGLEASLYGASFRFRVLREEFNEEPDPSDDNPKGLPERTIKEAQVFEFGPVTFPAYPNATAGVRSLTDEFLLARFAGEPEQLRELLKFVSRL
jgi:HK97 family phage prohead protease